MFDPIDYVILEGLSDKQKVDKILFGEQINFYPGTKGSKCCETAVFLSVTKAPPRAKWMEKSEMIPLERMFQRFFSTCKANAMKKPSGWH